MHVFISYRRRDDQFLPAFLRGLLTDRLAGGEVFLDIDNIAVGSDFAAHIRSWVEHADVVLALIGSGWRPELLANPSDFVRLELRSARPRQGRGAGPPQWTDDAVVRRAAG